MEATLQIDVRFGGADNARKNDCTFSLMSAEPFSHGKR